MCAPEIRSSVDRPDYWVECRPCDFRSEDYLNFKDCAAVYAAHCAESDFDSADLSGSNYEPDTTAETGAVL